MIKLDRKLTPISLLPRLERFWARSAECIDAVERSCPPGSPSPVFTVKGRYTAKGWTEWTQGFQYGSALLHFTSVQFRLLMWAEPMQPLMGLGIGAVYDPARDVHRTFWVYFSTV